MYRLVVKLKQIFAACSSCSAKQELLCNSFRTQADLLLRCLKRHSKLSLMPLAVSRKFLGQIIFIMLVAGQCCFASSNFLNSVVFEQIDGQSNIVLRTDSIAKIKKTVQSNDRITLTVKGITPSGNMSTIYKNFDGSGKIISEDLGNGRLKLDIVAPNVASANIIFNTPNSAPIYVGERFGHEKANWALTLFAFAGLLLLSANHRTRKIIKRRELRDREIEFYKAKLPSMNYKPTTRYSMNSIQKEIVLK